MSEVEPPKMRAQLTLKAVTKHEGFEGLEFSSVPEAVYPGGLPDLKLCCRDELMGTFKVGQVYSIEFTLIG